MIVEFVQKEIQDMMQIVIKIVLVYVQKTLVMVHILMIAVYVLKV